MADLKISQLTALAGANVVATDVLPIVDVSETTTKKITASELSSYVATTTPAARPLLARGAYLSGSGLVLSGLGGNYASTSDNAFVTLTGDIDIQVKVTLPSWTPATTTTLVAKLVASGNQQSFMFFMTTNGLLNLNLSSDGTGDAPASNSSTVATGFAAGATKWVRATLDVNDGSGNRVAKFYTSDDGISWTQLGTTVTTVGTTSMFDSNSPLEVGSRFAGLSNIMTGTVHRVIIRNGYDGAGSVVYDADFSTQTADALAFNATSDAGIKADGLVLKGVTGQYASAPDSAALSITGDIDIKVKVTLPDWTPASAPVFLGKQLDAGNQQSFYLIMLTSGVLRFITSATGAAPLLETDSTVATGFADGATKWVRVTMDADNGSSQRVIKFYTSDNGTSWTQLGTTVTAAGTASIFNSSAPLEIGSRNLGVNNLFTGTVHRAIIQSAYDTADNTTSLAFDADFDAQAIGTTSFVESSSNAAIVTMQNTNPTVTINTTRYSYGIPNLQSGTISIATLQVDSDRYQRFVVTKPTVVDMALIEVTTGPVSAATVYFGLYAADANLQPTGNVLLTTNLSVGAGATGVFTKQFTPITLQAGTYLLATNTSVTMSVRVVISGEVAVLPTYGTTGSIAVLTRTRTAATFGNNPNPWDTFVGSAPNGLLNYALLRWRLA